MYFKISVCLMVVIAITVESKYFDFYKKNVLDVFEADQ